MLGRMHWSWVGCSETGKDALMLWLDALKLGRML